MIMVIKPKVISPLSEDVLNIKKLLRRLDLHTVCEEANCPNIGECFSKKTATFMIMGDVCTRNCLYCSVTNGKPNPLDPDEPRKIAKMVEKLGLRYVVITSVDRDDLPDGGASHFVEVVRYIKEISYDIKVEILIGDFKGNIDSIKTVVDSPVDVINHNMETTYGQFKKIRPQGDYQRSLRVLKVIKDMNPAMITKSGLMVGFGESYSQIFKLLEDLAKSNVDIITIGQYLQPTKKNIPVFKYYTDEEFDFLREKALSYGFKEVYSGRLVRSSYHADKVYRNLSEI